MPRTKKSSGKKSGRRYSKAAGKTVESAMRRKKRGTLKSGPGGKGGKVTSRKQPLGFPRRARRARRFLKRKPRRTAFSIAHGKP